MMELLFGNARAGRIGDITLMWLIIAHMMGIWSVFSLYGACLIVQVVWRELVDYHLEQQTITRIEVYIFTIGTIAIGLVQLVNVLSWHEVNGWTKLGMIFLLGVLVALSVSTIKRASQLKAMGSGGS